MKRRLWITLLMLIMTISCLGVLSACKKSKEGPESGIFYYDGEGIEYLISLNSGDKFSFMVRDANKSGTYSLKGENLTLKFNLKSDGKLDATMSEDRNTIVLSYESAEMRFVRKATCTVTFETNGGSEVKSITAVNGKTIERPQDPTRDNYIFVGWFTDVELTNPFVFGTSIVTGDTTLYARWGERIAGQSDFNVSFDLNYENAPVLEDKKTTGGHLYVRPQPTREGFAFRGWWVSMYDNKDMLSYAITDDTIIKEDVVAYAVWEPSSATKLPMPEVWMTDTGVCWNIVSGASAYNIEIEGPAGFAKITDTTNTNFYALEWPGVQMGDFKVTVIATSGNSDNASSPAVCHYKNRALARVSRFEVVLSSTLIFNPVEGADYYTITVDCGDESHNHTDLDNGNSTYFNFSNCLMQEGGIIFVVTAHGENYMDSVSKTFVYDRSLEKVEGIRIDEETQVLHWNEVPNAADYILEIACPNENHHPQKIFNGNKTTFDLKECGRGNISVSITPRTKGYNSPEAATFSFTKTKIAAPGNFSLVGTEISWDTVEGAEKYTLLVDGVSRDTTDNKYDLVNMTNWASTSDYTLIVTAVDETGASSPASEPVDMRYMALYSTVTYYRNIFSWRHVLGATKYEVTLNDEQLTLTSGKNYVEVVNKFKAGENEFKLKFFDANNPEGSQPISFIVQAYEITFDARSGECGTKSICLAYGDRVELPTATRQGFTLDGWYNAPGGAESNAGRYLDDFYQELGDIILYASWAPERFTITYVYDDGRAGDGTEVTSVFYQRKFVFKLPTSIVGTNGFLGWFSEQGEGGEPLTDQFGVGYEPWDQLQGGQVYAHWAHVFDYTLLSDPSKIGGKIASVRSGPEVDLLSVLTVPAEYDGYPVKQVAGMAFMGHKDIKEINVPDSLILIGVDAFSGCESLEKVNIYETGTLLDEEVQYKSFDGVICKRVGDYEWALNYYPQARSGIYRIPDGVTQIGSGVFKDKPVTEIIIPSDVTLVAENAFDNCVELTKITFESALDSLKKQLVIENNAFIGCAALTQIVFPRQLYTLGGTPDGYNGIVKECMNLAELNVAEGNIYGYSSRDNMVLKDNSIVYVIPGSKKGTYTIPEYVIGVGPYAFAGMSITELTVPKTLRNIDEGAFLNNHELTKITFVGDTISGGQLNLGKYAFRSCDKLVDVIFEEGSTVGTLGSYCFDSCTNLETITLPANLSEIKNNAFNNCTSLRDVKFQAGEVGRDFLTLGRAIFNNCTSLTEVHLPAHVSEIVYGAFDGANSLKGVYVEKGGTYSDIEGVLYGNNVTELIYYPKTMERGGSVKLPETVTTIGDSVFKNFTRLSQITIPANVTYIGAEAFFGCTGLIAVIFEGSDKQLTFGTITDEAKEITGSFAFAGCSALSSLSIPARVTEIPAYFMYYEGASPVKMNSLAIPNSVVEIGEYAFYGARISSVNFSSELQFIGDYAFMGTSLTQLDLSNTKLVEIGDSAFEQLRVTSLSLNRNGSLRRIGDRAFYNLRASTVQLSEGLQEIGNEAFSGAPIIVLDFPATLKTLGDNAFKGCTSLQRYTIRSDVKFGLTVFAGCSSLFEVNIAEGVSLIPENMLEGTVVKKISLPSTIREIGQYAFANSALESVEFARSIQIEEIGVGAFQNCTALRSINLPEGIRTIGAYAFADCTGLTSFTVCASVTEVGDYAFSGCTELASITFSGTDSSGSLKLGSFVFMDCGKLETIHFPANLTTLNGTIFSGCDMLKNVTFAGAANNMFHDGLLISLDGRELILGLPGADNEEVHVPATVEFVTNEAFARSRFKRVIFDEGNPNPLTIGSETNTWTDACNVFANNDFIEEVTFPENLDTIGASAFENCTSLKKVNVPARVRYIGAAAFRETTHLESLDFRAASLEAIGSQAFYHAGVEGNGISPVSLPEGMREIESDIFSYAGFTELTIPSTVNVINKEAFTYCEKLKKVSITGPSRIRTIDEGAFRRCGELEEFNLAQESGVLNLISDEAFYLCEKLKAFNLPESSRLRTIGERAFSYTGIESFTVRSTIMAIEPFAFSGCSNMKTLTFEEGKYQLEMGDFTRTEISRFEAGTFQFCTSLEEVKLPERMTNIGTRMFAYCEGLKKVTIPASMKHMTDGMFSNCTSLDELIIPENTQLEWIGRDVFTESGPANFVIPATVKTIENNALMDAKRIKSITFADGIQIEELVEGMFAGCEGLEHVNFGTFHYEELPRAIFSGCKSLIEFTIPKHIKMIPGYAFRNCASLQHIYFEPDSVIETIEESAFEGAGPFEITIPKTVTSIGDSAFYGSDVKKVEFEERGGSVVSIGANAFGACTGLKTFTIPENAELGMHTFRDATGLETIYLAKSMHEIPDFMLTGCKNLKNIKFTGGQDSNGYLKIKENIIFNSNESILYVYACSKEQDSYTVNSPVTRIARGAFSYTTNLKTLTIGNTVTTIDHDAFQSSSIEKVIFNGNPSFGSAVFAYCENLREVQMTSCTKVGGSMFIGCESLDKVTWGNNLQLIDGNAFDSSSIREISTIPASCTEVGPGAFKNTPNLQEVTFASGNGNKVTIGVNAFEDSGLTKAVLPTNVDTKTSGNGQYMFKNCHNLKEVTLPTGADFTTLPGQMFCFDENLEKLTGLENSHVTLIEPSAFQGCKKLTSISLPNSLTAIWEQAFMSAGITSVDIPSSVVDVSELAFADCTSLKTVKFDDPAANAESISFGANVFEGCNALETLTLPERKIQLSGGNLFGNGGGIPFLKSIVIPQAMDEIPANFFANCIGLETVTFKNQNLKRIWSYAFMNTTSLKTINIPSTVTLIDTSAFEGSGLQSITIPGVKVETALSPRAFANCKQLTQIKFAQGFECSKIAEELFAGCSALTSVDLPACVTSIQKGAFSGCSAMTSFKGSNVTTVYPQVFAGCTALETVDFPKFKSFGSERVGWTTAEDSAFYGCVNLKTVGLTTDDSTREISFPAYVFNGCEKLETINSSARFTTAGNYAFNGCKSLATFDFTNLKSIGQYAFYDCESITSVMLQSSELPAISDFAFAENKALTEVTVQTASVSSIGECAFENCTALTTVNLQTGLNSIGKYAFSGCTALTKLIIPASVTTIDDGAFKGVKEFQSVGGGAYTIEEGVLYNTSKTELIAYFSDAATFTVPTSVQIIAESAFAGTNISTITISSNVEEIGAHAFEDCAQLTSVNFSNGSNLRRLGEYMFKNTPQLTSINLPDSINDFGSYVFSGSSITNLTIPASTNKISKYAFEGSALVSIIVPSNVTIIEEGAFMNSKNLEMASISADVTSVGDYMFAGCEKLKFDRVSLPDGVKNYSKHMFEGCLAFTEITIPTNITGFGSYCFNGCENLTKVTLHDSFKHLGDANTRDDGGESQYIFAGTSLTELEVPLSVSGWCFEKSEHMFDGLRSDSFDLKVKDNVTKLGTYMFANIPSPTFRVELPSHITAMGDYMFSGTKITSYTLSSKLVSLGKNAFEKTALESFEVEGSSEVSGDNIDVLSAESIFAGLTSSTFTLKLPGYIKAENLGNYMFEGLASTEFVLNLPEQIEYLPEGAFRRCENLEKITITGHLTSTTEWAEKDEEHGTPDGGYAGSLFEDCTKLQSVTLPDTLKMLGAKTFLNCSSLTEFKIGENVEKIAASCFEGCTSLKELTVPAKVIFVGSGAFRGWKADQHVTFQGSTAQFDEYWRSGAEGVNMSFSNNG